MVDVLFPTHRLLDALKAFRQEFPTVSLHLHTEALGAVTKLVLFADRDVCAPDPGWWPAGLVRDVPHAGEAIKRGAPVCTLISPTACAPEVAARGARLLAALPEAVLARG